MQWAQSLSAGKVKLQALCHDQAHLIIDIYLLCPLFNGTCMAVKPPTFNVYSICETNRAGYTQEIVVQEIILKHAILEKLLYQT